MEGSYGPDANAEGMLLYPAIDQDFRLKYRIQGHGVRICTVNLSAHWQDIRSELHDLISWMSD
mgnify:CR=1 FL=1